MKDMAKERFKIIPASYLVLIKDGKVLMLRRFNTGYEDGHYSLVAGHLDGNESFTQAMVREAKEEAGIKVDVDKLEVVHMMHRKVVFNDVGERERIDAFIMAKEWEGEPQNMEPHKCDDLSWFPIDNIPENTIPFVKQALECVQEKKIYSEFGF